MRAKRLQKDSKTFDISHWKNGFAIYWDEEDYSRIKEEGGWEREMRIKNLFENINFDMLFNLDFKLDVHWIVRYASLELKGEDGTEIQIWNLLAY